MIYQYSFCGFSVRAPRIWKNQSSLLAAMLRSSRGYNAVYNKLPTILWSLDAPLTLNFTSSSYLMLTTTFIEPTHGVDSPMPFSSNKCLKMLFDSVQLCPAPTISLFRRIGFRRFFKNEVSTQQFFQIFKRFGSLRQPDQIVDVIRRHAVIITKYAWCVNHFSYRMVRNLPVSILTVGWRHLTTRKDFRSVARTFLFFLFWSHISWQLTVNLSRQCSV